MVCGASVRRNDVAMKYKCPDQKKHNTQSSLD